MTHTVLASMSPFVRRSRTFSQADHFGASAAHHSILEHAIRYGAADEVHFILGQDELRMSSGAISELNHRLSARRASAYPISQLRDLLQSHSYVSLTRLGDWLQPAQARLALGQPQFPICAILHSVMLPNLLFAYSNILMSCSDGDCIVATSTDGANALGKSLEEAREFLARTVGGDAIKVPQTVHIPLGIADDYGPLIEKGAARNLLSLDQHETVILYFGRLSRTDKANLEPLLVAFSQLDWSASRLILAGQDLFSNYRATLEASARALGIAERVLIVPNCSPHLKDLLYTVADVFVSPVDNVQETFGITLLEAMAMSLPVVATDWCGYRDIVVDQHTGFLCPSRWHLREPTDLALSAACDSQGKAERFLAEDTAVDGNCLAERLRALVTNESLRIGFGKAGLSRVNQLFRWSRLMPRYADLWRNMAAATPRDNRRFPPIPNFAQIFSTYPSGNGTADRETFGK